MNAVASVNTMILASAGTGKTFELSNRYIRLLLDGVHPKSILATTFTRKAAGEILDRIVQRLAGAAADPTTASMTANELECPNTSQEKFGQVLRSLVTNLNNLQVETLDAFFFKIAQAFSLDMGMSPGWEIGEDSDIANLTNRGIRNSLTQRATVAIVHDLAKGEATRSISQMIRETVRNLYEVYRETRDTDCLAAWSSLGEMELLPAATLDLYAEKIRNLNIDATDSFHTKLELDLQKIKTRDWNALLKSGVFSKVAEGLNVFNRFVLPDELIELMEPVARHAVAGHINLLVRQTQGAFQFLQNYHKEFDHLKADHALLEFDDVAYLASLLFSHYPISKLAWRMDQTIDHLLLDEFQDTSIQQWQVLKPLAERVCQAGDQRSFFCVGDVKQAIYGWRGGVAEIFEEVQREFKSQLNDVDSRSKSYRSSPVVIEAVNEIFLNIDKSKKLGDQKPMVQSWMKGFEAHETARNNLPGSVTFEVSSVDWKHHRESAYRIKQIAEQFPNRTIGVLTRTNKEVARLIFELGVAGVKASEEGGNPLTDSAAVNILLSALRLLDHPDDMVSRFHVLHSPLANEFQLTIENFQQDNHPSRAATQSMRFELLDHGYGDLLGRWARILEPNCTEREWFRVGQLIEKGYSVSVADHLRTTEVVNWIEGEKVPDPSAAQINVMTIHKSKGLEFDIVVLPELAFNRGDEPTYIVGRESPTSPIDLVCRYMDNMKQGWLPPKFQKAFTVQREREIHEFLCSIYVATTRAKHAMHMIARHSSHAGKKNAEGLIMAALGIAHHPKNNAAKPGEVLWQRSSNDWQSETHGVTTDVQVTREVAEQQFGQIKFAPSSTSRNLPWESPSAREGGSHVQLGRILRLEDNLDSRLQGSLIHRCFEFVTWLEDSAPDNDLLNDKLQGIEGASAQQIKAAIAGFRKMLKKPNTSNLLRRDQFGTDLFNSYDEFRVINERPFAVRMDDAILSGFIDRLVLLVRKGRVVGADVVDFKTDSIPAGDKGALRNRVDVYKPQLQSYRDAVSRLYHLSPDDVSARLMFVAIDQQVPIH